MTAVQDAGATVLVAGSTGGVGQIVVAKLVERGFQVRALTRNKAKADEVFKGTSVETLELDLRDRAAVKASGAFEGCQAVVMAIGTTAFPSARYVSRPTCRAHALCYVLMRYVVTGSQGESS